MLSDNEYKEDEDEDEWISINDCTNYKSNTPLLAHLGISPPIIYYWHIKIVNLR